MPNTNNENLNQELILFLRQDELDYPAGAAKFGAAALPLLIELIEGEDENLAVKAAYLVGYIKDDSVKDIVLANASNKFSAVRVAAAYNAQKLKDVDASAVLEKAITDNDPGVLKLAMKSIEHLNLSKKFKAQLNNVAKVQLEDSIKEMAISLSKK